MKSECPTVVIPDAMRIMAEELAKERYGIKDDAIRDETTGVNRNEKGKPWWSHFIGLIGEGAFCKIYNEVNDGKLNVDISMSRTGDKYDFLIGGNKIDVKTRKNFDMFFVPLDELGKADVYVFVWLDKNIERAEIRGHINSERFYMESEETEVFGIPCREIHQSKLMPFSQRYHGTF